MVKQLKVVAMCACCWEVCIRSSDRLSDLHSKQWVVGLHFSSNCENRGWICSALPTYSQLESRFKQDMTLAFKGCLMVLFCCCLDFSPLTMHCRRGLIRHCLEVVKRVFSLVFRDVRTNWPLLCRSKGIRQGTSVPAIEDAEQHNRAEKVTLGKWIQLCGLCGGFL